MREYDYIIIGSGFGGSVSALRLAEKGYKVLVIEKGKWFTEPSHFPKTNWNLRKWLWAPAIGLTGLFKMTFFRHVGVLSGVGVGGGSLVYANTLPVPGSAFFTSGSWAGLHDWQKELLPYYRLAEKMLGAEPHPYMSRSEKVMQQLAREMGNEDSFQKTNVAVYFGTPEVTVKDPYFNGEGPDRTGCKLCGGCMLGCRFNSKNTLDKNYLWLAQKLGVEIMAEKEVVDVVPLSEDGSKGYEVHFKDSLRWFSRRRSIKAKGVIFAGGVMGTVPLLLKLRRTSLPLLSPKTGMGVRTNSESLIGVTTREKVSFSEGIAIGSIVQIDERRSVEPVKYSEGSGFWRLFMAPMITGRYWFTRLFNMVKAFFTNPVDYLRMIFIDDWSKRTQILLYMESIDSSLSLKENRFGGMRTTLDSGPAPTAFNPVAHQIAGKVETIINGRAMVMNTEALFGIPTTAHILGGACMGATAGEGVIDKTNHVFNYRNLLVCDGSMISANPGVNPSLSITAIAEHAMAQIPHKSELEPA